MTSGKQFEIYMGRFFIYQGYRVTFTKAGGDYGADLILEKDGIRTVVQCRQRKENTGVDAVQAVHSAKDVYDDAPNALVISTSEFTKPALNLAKINKIVCWDKHQLLQELYKWQYFVPPE
jgi:restriction system protein